ncbi:hypothetical protein HMPREF1548_06904 [Clostridium sp. KLE 1755]|nr:hypothetical protein HMPREF1548_06904 [Clostridium sp. KLE 1755]
MCKVTVQTGQRIQLRRPALCADRKKVIQDCQNPSQKAIQDGFWQSL